MESSSKRILSEVVGRLKCLKMKELQFFIHADRVDKANILWIAVCKKYPLISDFAKEGDIFIPIYPLSIYPFSISYPKFIHTECI